MNIDEATKLINDIKKEYETMDALGEYVTAIETLINEYNNLKQIEEAHRVENGELREEIKDLEEILDDTWSGFKGIQEDLTNQLRNMPPAEYC